MELIVVVAGGNRNIDHYRHMLESLLEPFYVIGVDAGAIWLIENREKIDLAVGDFDTIGEEGISSLKKEKVEMIQAVPEKDETDTELAVAIAVKRNAKRILIYGGVGTRFDHSLANIQLLWKCFQDRIDCEIIDPLNRIKLIDKPTNFKKDHSYISLIPFSPAVSGVTLVGFKYPLRNATLKWGSSLGISNELVAEIGIIKLKDGVLLVVMSND